MKSFQLSKKEELNDFITNQKHSQFLQSWEWGEFQENNGKKVIKIGFKDNEDLIFAILLIKNSLPVGLSYLYSPRIGIKYLSDKQLNFVFEEIKSLAKQEKAVFFRFEPRSELRVTSYELRAKRTIDIQPRKTLILDLNKEEEEIFNSMHQKTRYNIRLSHKKGVKVRDAGLEEFDAWWQIMDETKERDQFRLHSKKYYKKMISISFIKLVVAEYQGKIIAGNILSFFGDTCTYVHGASSNEFRNVMAPFALQWQTIQVAKKQGLKYYDFYGIDEEKWPGVTRFKKGFLPASRQDNGGEINYPGTFDMVFDNNKYLIYKLLRKIRRLF